jgi:hypothetical protein
MTTSKTCRPKGVALSFLVASSALGGCFAGARTGGEGLNANGVRNRASFDFNCPQESIQVQDLDGRSLSFGARGCAKRATYVWKGSTVILNSPIASDPPAPP